MTTHREFRTVTGGVPTERMTNARLPQASYALLLLTAFASTWTGLAVAGMKPSDLTLALATLAATPVLLRTRVPSWVLVGMGTLILVTAIHLWLPISPMYMLGRYQLPRLPGTRPPTSAVLVSIQWSIALFILPWLTRALCGGSIRRVERLLVAWLLGAVVSVLFALSDALRFTHVASTLTHGALTAGRQSGLAAHVNHFGFACAIAVPISIFLIARDRKLLGISTLALLVIGSLLSGSRGAQLGTVSACVLSAMCTHHGRRLLPPIIWGASLSAVVAFTFWPGLVGSFTDLVRFGDPSAYVSDEARAMAARQSIEDFRTHPIAGIGFEVLNEAHSLLLEVLATGGVVLLVGLIVYYSGAVRSGFRAHRAGYALAGFAVASVATFLLMGLFQNQIADRYLYIPIAAICAISNQWTDTPSTSTVAQGRRWA